MERHYYSSGKGMPSQDVRKAKPKPRQPSPKQNGTAVPHRREDKRKARGKT
jgi:hypothetical protein